MRRRSVLAASVAVLCSFMSACGSTTRFQDPVPTTVTTLAPAAVKQLLPPGVRAPLALTYFFYWYDAQTRGHLRPEDGLPTHLPAQPPPTWRSDAWFRKQLTDMTAAGLNVALPVYWGDDPREPWSAGGLPHLVAARHQLVAAKQAPPTIGMFYDTSIVRGVDLTKRPGIDRFYANIKSFFQAIPTQDWARLDGRPVVWLFLPQDNRFDQRVFDAVYSRFSADFGVRPYIVRATGWDCPTNTRHCSRPIRTDASYVWGTAQDGMQVTPLVASVGPGYDERQLPGRRGLFVDRDESRYYRRNLSAALDSGRPLLAIETWNEIHEASGIGETTEYGRRYITLTRSLLDRARAQP